MSDALPGPGETEIALFTQMEGEFARAHTVAVSGHLDPDGDALGSTLALTMLIEATNPNAVVTPLLANKRSVPRTYAFLPGSERLVWAGEYRQDPDLFVSVDTPVADRLADSAKVLARAARSIAIDHHSAMEPFADVSLRRESAASTGDIIFDLMNHMGMEATPQVANCLMTAILTDTGGFRYQNTDAHAMAAASRLIACGARPAQISDSVYQSFSVQSMHLKALAMERIGIDETGLVAYSYVGLDDIERLGASKEDCDSLIDTVRAVGGVDACVFLRETAPGLVRANLRAKSEGLDVSRVAAQLGGGGHRGAAGLTYKGDMRRALRDVVALLAAGAVQARQVGGDAAGDR